MTTATEPTTPIYQVVMTDDYVATLGSFTVLEVVSDAKPLKYSLRLQGADNLPYWADNKYYFDTPREAWIAYQNEIMEAEKSAISAMYEAQNHAEALGEEKERVDALLAAL